MKSFLIIPLLFLSFGALSQKTKNDTDRRLAGLDAIFNKVLKDWHAAGFAVAVVEKNKIIYAKGFGYRDVEKQLAVTANTLFAIGSCTKAFTASLIGLLQKEGKVDLDKPATSFLPELKFYNNNLDNNVTPRDMLSHRTGLPRHDFSWYLFPTNSRDSLMHRIRYMEPSAPLREKWQYNNFMYLTLGVMDEKLTGNTWEKDVKEKFLDPLQMVNSNFTIKDLVANPDASLGYGLKKDSIIKRLDHYNIAAMSPAGAINSSVNEMSNWVITWINDGKFNGKQIIPSEFRQQAISSQSIMGGALPGKEKPGLYFSNYGFGWMLSSYNGHYRVEHGGNIDGFSASTSFFPSDSIGIIVLSNQDGSVVPSIIRNTIADRMLGLKFYDWNADMLKSKTKGNPGKDSAEKKPAKKLNMPLTHSLKDYAGNYFEPGYGTLMITFKNDSLFSSSVNKIYWMHHNNYDVFDLFEKDKADGIDTTDLQSGIQFQFQLNTGGDIESLSIPLESTIKPIIFKKQLIAKNVSKESLQKYVGDYDLKGITVKFYLKNDQTLYAFVPGQPEYELVPVEKDKFAIKVLSGYFIQFDVDQNNKVTSTTFMQPNGNFQALKK
jgi:CubicO group peptidase (beta-lactamase class C family)